MLRSISLLVSALMLDGGLAHACLHGATGKEQTSVVRLGANGDVREDRLRVSPTGGRFAKIFVAAPFAKIEGITLQGETAKIHEDLAQLSAWIAYEGTRGAARTLAFEGTQTTGRLVELTAAEYPDWKTVGAKLNIPSQGKGYDDQSSLWLRNVRSSGRAAYALIIEAGAGALPMLAVRITYPGVDNLSGIALDKMLEAAIMPTLPEPTSSITWFVDVPNKAVEAAVAMNASAVRDDGYGAKFLYSLPSVGTADARPRTWTINEKSADPSAPPKSTERSGILWMQ